MTSVIAGAARGRKLTVPASGTRPTSGRAREGLFSSLESLYGALHGARVLDLFGGSGAIGLEALSRGAAHVFINELDPKAVKIIRGNVESVGLPGAEVRCGQAEAVPLRAPAGGAYDIVFLDPPYAMPGTEVTALLKALLDGGWIAEDAVIAAERKTRGGDFDWPDGVEAVRSRKYGEGTLWYGRAARAC